MPLHGTFPRISKPDALNTNKISNTSFKPNMASVGDFASLREDVVTSVLDEEREARAQQKAAEAKAKRQAAAAERKQQQQQVPKQQQQHVPKVREPEGPAPIDPEIERQEREAEQKFKQQLLDKIGKYRQRFPDLEKRNNCSIKSDVEVLQDELHYIEEQLGEPRDVDDNYLGLGLVAAMYGAEYMVDTKGMNPMNLNLTGLGDTTKLNLEKFEPLLEELAIKWNAQMSVSAELRLAMLIGTTRMTVHAANNGMSFPSKIVSSQEYENVQADIDATKYSSL